MVKVEESGGPERLPFYDMRHTALTNLLSSPRVSIQTAKAIGGHIDPRMIERYAHIHLADKREAIGAITLGYFGDVFPASCLTATATRSE